MQQVTWIYIHHSSASGTKRNLPFAVGGQLKKSSVMPTSSLHLQGTKKDATLFVYLSRNFILILDRINFLLNADSTLSTANLTLNLRLLTSKATLWMNTAP